MAPIHDPFQPPSLGETSPPSSPRTSGSKRHGTGCVEQDIADIVRISRSAVSLRFTGKAPWTLDELGRLTLTLGMAPADLMVPLPHPTRPRW